MGTRHLARRLAVAGAAGGLAITGVLASASTAAADNHSPTAPRVAAAGWCGDNFKNFNTRASATAHLRSTPVTGKSLGLVHNGTKVRARCYDYWNVSVLVTVRSGANKGKEGWVHSSYIRGT